MAPRSHISLPLSLWMVYSHLIWLIKGCCEKRRTENYLFFPVGRLVRELSRFSPQSRGRRIIGNCQSSLQGYANFLFFPVWRTYQNSTWNNSTLLTYWISFFSFCPSIVIWSRVGCSLPPKSPHSAPRGKRIDISSSPKTDSTTFPIFAPRPVAVVASSSPVHVLGFRYKQWSRHTYESR